MIYRCDCKNEAQDKLHGKGKRVHNVCNSVGQAKIRCTVCKAEKFISEKLIKGWA